MGEIYQSIILYGIKKQIRVNAFLDSGATTTYIKKHLIEELGFPIIKKSYVELGDGNKISGYNTSIILKVKGRIKTISAVGIEMPEDLILGHDFFQDNNVILDYSKDKFKFSNRVPMANRRLRL